MPIVVWIAAAAVAVALPLAWWALASDRTPRPVTQYLTDQPTLRQAELRRSAGERLFLPFLRSIGTRIGRFTPAGWLERRTRAIGRSGLTGRITAEQVLGAKLLLVILVGGLLLVRGVGLGPGPLLFNSMIVVAVFFIPDLALRAAADRRAEEVQADLPDVLDQMTISVEAGLGFESALARIAEDNDHPLAQEFGRMQQDIQLGASRIGALEAMGRRIQIEDMRTVVVTLRQAESLGVPIAQTLRNVSAEMREKRRFRAEENANSLPVKMVVPLGLCILPALFIVIMGPAILRYLEVIG